MSVLENILEIALSNIVKETSQFIKGSIEDHKNKIKPKLDHHLRFVSNWADRIEHYELSQGRDTLKSTIDLDLALTPKKIGKRSYTNVVNSDSLSNFKLSDSSILNGFWIVWSANSSSKRFLKTRGMFLAISRKTL